MDHVLRQFMRINQLHNLWRATDRVVIAVSTGVDSTALLDLFLQLPKRQRPQIFVAHVNHKLRAQSDDEEAFLRAHLKRLNVPLFVATWPLAEHPDHGIEAAARVFRYQFFKQVMRETSATVLATAHQEDEMVETGVMRLTAGHGFTEPLSIAWQRPFANGQLIRPLLGMSKATLRDYVQQRDLTFFEDASNAELTTARNRVRHQLMPQLVRENPAFQTDFAATLLDQVAVNTYLRSQAKQALKSINHSVSKLLSDPLPTILLLQEAFDQVTDEHHVAVKTAAWHNVVDGLVQGKPECNFDLGGGWQLRRRYDYFDFKRLLNNPQKNVSRRQPERETMVTLNKWTDVMETCQIGLFDADQVVTMRPGFMSVHLHVAAGDLPLLIRQAKATDQLRLQHGQHQSVRRLLINQKVPQEERDHQLLVTTVSGEPLWLVGRRVAVTTSSQQLVEICVKLGQGAKHE